MILIGSRALIENGVKLPNFNPDRSDWDYIATQEQWDEYKLSYPGLTEVPVDSKNVQAFMDTDGIHHEGYITKKGDGNSDDMLMNMLGGYDNFIIASPSVCLAIKESHKYKKNTRNFIKTMTHIKVLRSLGYKADDSLTDFMKARQKESLNYGHPKLNVSKETFFDDTIYKYDHDSIHRAIAIDERPAYISYIVDGEEVLTSKEKFFAQPEIVRLLGVYEETCVLALERSQIPNDFRIPPEKSFAIALEKVCTSITSGWFREYAYENYSKILAIYKSLGKNDYVVRFKENFDMILPFKNGDMNNV